MGDKSYGMTWRAIALPLCHLFAETFESNELHWSMHCHADVPAPALEMITHEQVFKRHLYVEQH